MQLVVGRGNVLAIHSWLLEIMLPLEASLSFPILNAGDDITAEQVAALRAGQIPGGASASTTTGDSSSNEGVSTTGGSDNSLTSLGRAKCLLGSIPCLLGFIALLFT